MGFRRIVVLHVIAIGIVVVAPGACETAERASSIPSPHASPPPAPKILRYAKHLLERYDADNDGVLSTPERKKMNGRPDVIDRDHDGAVTLAELIQHIAEYGRYRRLGGALGSPANGAQTALTTAARPTDANAASANDLSDSARRRANAPFYVPSQLLPAGLPNWFAERDLDGDGQLSLAEYAPSGGRDRIAAFTRLDANRDGILTPTECVEPTKPPNTAPPDAN